MQPRILIADDDDGILTALNFLLKSEGYSVEKASTPKDVLRKVRDEFFQIVLMDLNYSLDTTSGEEGLKLIQALRQLDALLPIVVMTGWGSIDIAVNTLKHGANDFIQKPWDNAQLLSVLHSQIQGAKGRRVQHAQATVTAPHMDGTPSTSATPLSASPQCQSPAMQSTLTMLEQAARSDLNILLTGENGTGKSRLARYLHSCSARHDKPIVSVNMGAVTESLFESEMFGHTKGAFTDAKDTRTGRFEMADTGTLFLDEIANTPLSQQAKLLRALEEKQFERVGSSTTQAVDIRLVTATNICLLDAVKLGTFRKDLYYRINAIEIRIPALRERREDILELAQHFLQTTSGQATDPLGNETARKRLSESAQAALLSYSWPGNVRELQHCIERAYVLTEGPVIEAEALAIPLSNSSFSSAELESTATSCHPLDEQGQTPLHSLETIEKHVVKQRYEHFNGDANQAAKSLGLSRSAFYRRLGKLKDAP